MVHFIIILSHMGQRWFSYSRLHFFSFLFWSSFTGALSFFPKLTQKKCHWILAKIPEIISEFPIY